MSKNNQSAAAGYVTLCAVLVTLALIPLSGLWQAYVVATIWCWFVPSALGLPAIGTAQAFGLVLLQRVMSLHYTEEPLVDGETQLDRMGKGFIYSFAAPLVGLGMSWVVHTYFL